MPIPKRCDNCFFSIWMMSSDRPMLGCKQRAGRIGRWWIVRLEQSCSNFYPSTDYKLGFPDARPIPLTKGKFALVDSEDYYRLARYKWCSSTCGAKTFYAGRRLAGGTINMHRLIMDAPSHLVVDHIDHNGLNNTKANLRLCTFAQNARNTRPNKGASSRYKGVSWKKSAKKWSAMIRCNKKISHLGSFENEIAAAKAYDKKAAEFFGEFAYLNFPPSTGLVRGNNQLSGRSLKS
jgi:hypothetical protein